VFQFTLPVWGATIPSLVSFTAVRRFNPRSPPGERPEGRGVPFAILAQIMGWSTSATITMAKRYGHIGDSSLRRAMSVLDFLDRRETMTEKSPELAVVAGTRSA
jgi:hypothetical protein